MAEEINDINVPKIKELDQLVRSNPAMGKVTFKASSTWKRGTKTVVNVGTITAQGQSLFPPTRSFVSGIATNAALFGVPLDEIEIELEADADLRGMLGHDKTVRNGLSDIRYTVSIKSPAPEDKVRRCKETIDRKSPVRDTIANPVNVTSRFVYKPR